MVFCRNTFPGFAGESMLSGSYSFFSGETGKTAVAFATAARLRQQAGASQAKPSRITFPFSCLEFHGTFVSFFRVCTFPPGEVQTLFRPSI